MELMTDPAAECAAATSTPFTSTSSTSERTSRSVIVVGAGGNIGSHLTPHLARMPGVGRIVLIDFDTYESKNLRTQDVSRRDVGRPKVSVQAKRLKAINADVEVRPWNARVEEIPLGRLRADVIVACLDSRISRQAVNQAAWRLGVPWIDAGVAAGGELLARVNVYRPAPDVACLECGWSDEDYRNLEVRHACRSAAAVTSTNAPAHLGGLAASLAAIECGKVLDGDWADSLAGRQVILDARHHTHFVTSFRKNPRCRFDHRTWSIARETRSPKKFRLSDVSLIAGQGASDGGGDVVLSMEGERFWMTARCPRGCESVAPRSEVVGLASRMKGKVAPCLECGEPTVPRGWDLAEGLSLSGLSPSTLRRTLASLGFVGGDLCHIRCGSQETYLELN